MAKRQVIMVTHNANLVINTDADQIIVAEAGPHSSGGLSPISYVAGGLEDAAIRRLSTTSLREEKLRSANARDVFVSRSEEHTSELQSLMRISYAVFCLKKKNKK